MTAPSRLRPAAALLVGVLLTTSFAACSAGSPAPDPVTSSEGGQTMPLQSVYDAVGASDPRVQRVSTVALSQSGPTEMMSVVLRITGDEPVSTETLENILRAAHWTTINEPSPLAADGVGGIHNGAAYNSTLQNNVDQVPAANRDELDQFFIGDDNTYGYTETYYGWQEK